MPHHSSFMPIGYVHSCFNEKFGTPRQAGLAVHASADIELLSPWDTAEAWSGMEAFSHIWVLFLFDRTADQGWKASVRPPRLGGNKKLGVFATRSNFRPNPIGMSAVKLEQVLVEEGKVRLRISGMDIVDGTPVLDIKPYIPYADSIPDAAASYADTAPQANLEVVLAHSVKAFFDERKDSCPFLRELLLEVLAQDPRPAYHKQTKTGQREYGITLAGFNFRWQVKGKQLEVLAVES